MTANIIKAIGATAALMGSTGLLGLAALTTNLVVSGASAPAMSADFKSGNGWSSGDYFGPRSATPTQGNLVAKSFREGNGWSSGDYFGPKG